METLACMSARTCSSCWHFRQGQCVLMAQLQDVLAPAARPPPTATYPLLAVA